MVSLKGITPREPRTRDPQKPVSAQMAGMCKSRLKDLDALRIARGGFKGEARGKAVYLQSYLLRRGTQMTEAEIESRALELGASCIPPLHPDICKRTVVDSRSLKKVSNLVIVGWLQMTAAERKKLFNTRAPEKKRTTKERRLIVQEYVHSSSYVPSYQEVVGHLETLHIKASRSMIASDYKALGIQNPRTPL